MNKKHFLLIAAFSSLGFSTYSQATTTWVGTATYPGQTSTDPFSTYDFGTGVALIKPTGPITTGTTFTGFYQTMVSGHFLGNTGVAVPNLNITGIDDPNNANDFELTMTAQFSGTYTDVSGSSIGFTIDGGNASLFYDSSPDYNFSSDTGFDNDQAILQGSITSGTGTILTSAQIGVESLTISFLAGLGFFDPAVYDPDTIGGGNALFTIQTGSSSLNSITSVMGQTVNSGDLLAQADGSLELTAVPVPAAAWLFGSGFVGMLGLGRRRTAICA